jgi:aryl-phospho-beta-D-glucosidase BglC (GH1 family)
MSGSLLPYGYLSASGAQLFDADGSPATIESISWYGTEGPSGSTLDGLASNNPADPATAAGIASYLSAIAAEGFNTVRIPWSDVNLQSSLPLFQAVAAEAGQLGLKIIFDHHDDDGHYSQQSNGLWYDSGGDSNGTDGDGDTGTVTAARFQADSVALAQGFAGNATVIGYDLDNEPLVQGLGTSQQVNWGGGGPNDILAMYDQVGSAVEAADPGALIIAEGPQNWTGTLMNGQNGMATQGDLSAAGQDPVTLTVNGTAVSGKIVYSVHEYPATISADPTDSGAAYIAQMNAAWGYLESNNLAPVWVGEIGASLDGSGADSASAGALSDEQNWAATIVPYLNGADAAQGGPAVKTGFDWWSSGNFGGGAPDGYNSGPNGTVNPAQQAVVGQLLAGRAAAGFQAPAGPSIDVQAWGNDYPLTAVAPATAGVGDAVFDITSYGTVSATLGQTFETIAFTGLSGIELTSGSAGAIVTADGGDNSFAAGSGALQVSGGSGADTYVYHAGAGELTVWDFSSVKGDSLAIDSALGASMGSWSDGQGGTFLAFAGTGGIDLRNVGAVPWGNIHWQ